MGSRYERILAIIETNRSDIPLLSHNIQNISSRLSAIKAPCPVEKLDKLNDAIEQAVEYTPVEKQHIEELTEIDLTETTLANELSRQSFWTGTINGLECLKIPSVETIDVFENKFDTANRLIQ